MINTSNQTLRSSVLKFLLLPTILAVSIVVWSSRSSDILDSDNDDNSKIVTVELTVKYEALVSLTMTSSTRNIVRKSLLTVDKYFRDNERVSRGEVLHVTLVGRPIRNVPRQLLNCRVLVNDREEVNKSVIVRFGDKNKFVKCVFTVTG